ncbi:GFA family protein [Amorphus orientalis]|uniref:CENP-V/GFA domain-containing protein n=1 Tax=Amorphus orientalis TaxID=649198 RepID=A0AAE3VNV1_9HYPH|nr:GFA family protein [Amorphus orientalis]MDQ0315085.1 hypothetical protein [Amorphus orientalis]
MSDPQTYTGGCQCGAVRYEVDIAIDKVNACNCSRCGKLGSLLAFTPAENFRLKTDKAALTEYQFNTHAIHHLFCSTCGIQSFALGTAPNGMEMAAINVRCLDGVDPAAFPVNYVDGASR